MHGIIIITDLAVIFDNDFGSVCVRFGILVGYLIHYVADLTRNFLE